MFLAPRITLTEPCWGQSPPFNLRLNLNLQKIVSDRDPFKDLARIIPNFRDLPAVVARAEVRGNKVFGSGFFGNASGVFHRGVFALAGHIDGVRAERRFMDERGALVRKLNRAL